MIPLHAPRASNGTYPFLFDGVLSFGNLSYYVQAVPFGHLSIGGYGTETRSACDTIWIQSQFCARDASLRSHNRPFYRIRESRSEYRRYHEPLNILLTICKRLSMSREVFAFLTSDPTFTDGSCAIINNLVRPNNGYKSLDKWTSA